MDYSDLTDKQIVDKYDDLADMLKETLAGLSESQYDLKTEANTWSIRQITHHLMDSDFLVQNIIMAAIGKTGCQYDQSWYPTDNSWAETLEYHKRSLEPSLQLFRVSHAMLLSIIRDLPDALDRNAQIRIENRPEWQHVTVRQLLLSRLFHSDHHMQQIKKIRQAKNL
jgi:hypothetical protein